MSDQRPTEDDFELIAERCQGIACSVSGDRRDPIDAIDALSDVVFDLARLTLRLVPERPSAQAEVDQLQFGKLQAENARLTAERDELRCALKHLTFQARTSGGTAGSDPALMAACERAEELLSTDAARGEGG